MATANRKKRWYDLHCHVLPGMDDGCKTAEESLRLLKEDWAQGIFGVIATPHFYPKESIADFLNRRKKAVNWLREQAVGETELPDICCGAEVAYHSGLVYDEDLELLCMGRSNYLLLELPFSAWPPTVLRDIATITGRGITPIIAHIERYIDFQTERTAQELFGMDVLIQMNAGTLEGSWKGRYGRNMIREGKIDVLSSDAHNLTSRPPNLGLIGAKYADSRIGDEIENIRRRNREVFRAAWEGGRE